MTTRHSSKHHSSSAPLVLIIENDPGNRLLAESILSMRGFCFRSVGNGQDALARIRDERFALILTDLSMPGMDGCDLIRQIRAFPDYASVPIVAITAHRIEEKIRDALSAGCTELLTKPYRPAQLIALVNRHLALAPASVGG